MTVITVTNRKGGVGKTTASNHLAAGLATLGYRVALVDTDSQGNCASTLQMPREDGLFDLLVASKSFEEVVREVPAEHYSTADFPSRGALYLVPSADKTAKIPFELSQYDSFIFLDVLDEMKQALDLNYLVIDTNPSLTAFDSYIYMATDAYLYVTEAERLANEAVERSIEQMVRFAHARKKHLNRDATVLGIIPNKVRKSTGAHQVGLDELKQRYGQLVLPEIALRTVWVEASLLGQLVYNYAPSSEAAAEAWQVVKHTIEGLKRWQTQKANG